ncbi:MAG: hypothetical protein K2O18_10295 [Oscillospiraceae bacterium]|nr:hypothetical protein [Oscillospiraceae bacterium]
MNELDELLLQMADDFRRDYEDLPLVYVRNRRAVVNLESCTDLPLIMAAIKQLAVERDGLTGKIAQLERLAEELQRKSRKCNRQRTTVAQP